MLSALFSKPFSKLEKDLALLRRTEDARDPQPDKSTIATAKSSAKAPDMFAGTVEVVPDAAFVARLNAAITNSSSFEDDLRQYEIHVLEALAVNVFVATERSMGVMVRSVDRSVDAAFRGDTLRFLARHCPASPTDGGSEPDSEAATVRMVRLHEEGQWAAASWFPGKRDAAAVAAALHAEGKAIAATCDGWDETVAAAVYEHVTVALLNRLHHCVVAWIERVSAARKTGKPISPAELMAWRARWLFSPEDIQIVAYYGDIDLSVFGACSQELRATIQGLREAGRLQRAALPDPTANSAGGSPH
jgi:hypothetical protein